MEDLGKRYITFSDDFKECLKLVTEEVSDSVGFYLRHSMEKEQIEALPPSKTMQHFWQGIITGLFSELKGYEEEILLKNEYLKYDPITSLTERELEVIKTNTRRSISENVNRHILRDLTQKDLAYIYPGHMNIPEGIEVPWHLKFLEKEPIRGSGSDSFQQDESFPTYDDNYHFLYCMSDNTTGETHWMNNYFHVEELRNFLVENNLAPLSGEGKLNVLSQPTVWATDLHDRRGNTGLTRQGVFRDLGQYGLYKGFGEKMSSIRESTGKNQLKVLDIGGGVGFALTHGKSIDPDIETINLCIEEEAAMYPTDKTYLCPAELMPKELEENVDFAMSNMAFRYFTYPDVALMNVIKSLSIGGEAYINFATDRSPLPKDELNKRCEALGDELVRLRKEGYIQVGSGNMLHIKKVKSLHITGESE